MDEKKEVKKMDKKVTIKYAGLAPWTLAYKGRPSITVYPQKTVTLNMNDRQDLKHLLEVCKWMNSSANEQSRVRVTQFGKTVDEVYHKWEIVEGKEHIPDTFLKLTYSINSFYDEQVNDVIKTFVPDYFVEVTQIVELKRPR